MFDNGQDDDLKEIMHVHKHIDSEYGIIMFQFEEILIDVFIQSLDVDLLARNGCAIKILEY